MHIAKYFILSRITIFCGDQVSETGGLIVILILIFLFGTTNYGAMEFLFIFIIKQEG